MGKSRKRQRLDSGKPKPAPSPLEPDLDAAGDADDDGMIGGLLLPDELQITIDTLELLVAHPALLKHRALRPLKPALWAAHAAHASQSGLSAWNDAGPTARVSAALADGRWTDARALLAEMQVRRQAPKLGALQRWVRECDAAAARDGAVVWAVLDAILRTTAGAAAPTSASAEAVPMERAADWVTRAPTGLNLWDELQSGTLVPDRAALAAPFLPLLVTPGPERRPPNHFASTVFYAPECPLVLAPDGVPAVRRLEHPVVPGAFMLHDVLAPAEARAFVAAAEAVGLERDLPASGTAVGQTSVLADNLVWLADSAYLSVLFARVREHLPAHVGGGALAGLNARFRLYRYRPGNHYRPHIDGAWPASALGTDASGAPCYVYDSDPALYSRLTFLLYLNGPSVRPPGAGKETGGGANARVDGFPGGATTFFLPADGRAGLVAHPVLPVMGAAMVFPHGTPPSSRGFFLFFFRTLTRAHGRR
jgi:hypothetical protein